MTSQIRRDHLARADARAMEEQHERMNPVNPKKTLGSRKGRVSLVAPDVEYSGGSATPSMGLSQYRGGSHRDGAGKSEEHMMGKALKKHLLGLHGAGFYKGFSDGFLEMDSDSDSEKEYVGGKAWNAREHTPEENAEYNRKAMEAYQKRNPASKRAEDAARNKEIEKDQAKKRAEYLASEQYRDDQATQSMSKKDRYNYYRDKYEAKHPTDRFFRKLGEGAEDILNKVAKPVGDFLGNLDPAGLSETLTGKKLSENIESGIRGLPKSTVALGEAIVGKPRKRGKGKLVITHGGAATGRYEGLGQGCGKPRRVYEGSGLQKRNIAVKRVMADKGMSMIDASKYIKEHGY